MSKLLVFLPVSFLFAGLFSGCGIGTVATSSPEPVRGTAGITGIVHGGQQPVSSAKVYMYRAGTGGNGTAAVSMLNSPGYVTTDSTGSFTINTDYTCNAPTDQVYMVALGGNPGLSAGTDNPALVMLDVLGSCGSLSSATNIFINEVTTAAAAWTLAPFMTSYASVASSATNAAGIANAFKDAALLADPGTGAPPVALPSNLSIPTGKLYGLADALATCVNSDGGAGCSPLFTAATPSSGIAPADTLAAALNIVRNPLQNPAAVFNVIPADPVFATSLTEAPYDWTMTMTITGGGILAPTALDIDSNGNVWVGDYYGALSEFSPQGTPLSGTTGFGVGALNEVYGLTIDTNGYVWAANEESSPNGHGSVSKFYSSLYSTPGTIINGNGGTNFYDSTIDYPVALAADNNGSFFIANYANSSASVYSSAGTLLRSGLGAGFGDDSQMNPLGAAYPVAAVPDVNHGVWIANLGFTTITHVDVNNNKLANPTCCEGANGLATDSAGNVWVSNYYGNSFSEVKADGTVLINGSPLVDQAVNESYPAGISVDAAQNVWVANYRGESISAISGANSATPGTLLSGAAGLGYSGPTTQDPLLLLPYAVIPDASGNLWVSSFGNNNLVLFFGLATPTATPTQPVPIAP